MRTRLITVITRGQGNRLPRRSTQNHGVEDTVDESNVLPVSSTPSLLTSVCHFVFPVTSRVRVAVTCSFTVALSCVLSARPTPSSAFSFPSHQTANMEPVLLLHPRLIRLPAFVQMLYRVPEDRYYCSN